MSPSIVPIPLELSHRGGILNRAIVIKIGGATLGSHDTVIEDLVGLQKQARRLVVVHGGAKAVNDWLSRRGATARFIHGERVTDEVALETVTAVLGGLVNKEIVAAINSLGGQAVGLTGIDGNLLQGRVRDNALGYVAEIVMVDTSLLEALLMSGFIPVVAPLTMYSIERPAGAPLMLNVNGDTAAGEIAAAMRAERLIFLTDVAGIRDESGKLMSELSSGEAEALIASGIVSGGMVPKIRACLVALPHTSVIRIIDGRQPHALLKEIEEGSVGTTIRSNR